MPVRGTAKQLAAVAALKALQEDAKRKGLDATSMADINGEIAAYRREQRTKRKIDKRPNHR